MVTSKTFDTSTIQGMKSADRYKNTLNNKFNKVTVQTIGWERVRIFGSDPIGRTRQAKARKTMRCNQCEALMINGVFCHETGCPNARSRYDSETGDWIKQRKCFECGCMVDADDECCNAEVL